MNKKIWVAWILIQATFIFTFKKYCIIKNATSPYKNFDGDHFVKKYRALNLNIIIIAWFAIAILCLLRPQRKITSSLIINESI